MGYVPPTLEEWNNPQLMVKRVRRDELRLKIILVATLLGFIMIIILALLHETITY